MSNKKLLALVLVIALGVAMLAGCAQTATTAAPAAGETEATTAAPAAPAEKKVVGVMIGDMSAQFHAYIMDGMKKEAEKYPDVEFVYVDGKFDPNVQMGQAENFIAEAVDAIVYIPGDAAAAKNLVDKVSTAGIPLIGVNTEVLPEDMDKLTSYAGSVTIESGILLGEAFAKVMGGKANMIELQGFYGHEPQIMRHEGILEAFKSFPDMKILKEDSGEWNRDKAMQKMENIINSDLNGKFDAVICHNDEMAIGAMKALEAAGMLDKVKVAGIDATPEALKYMKEGKIAFTVFQDARGQGAKGIEIAVKVINGETVEKRYTIPYVTVMPEEADKYLALYE
ncbi:MAG: substrate-binding domain-containing protein [Eubacteriales bacterium]|nr:substrate-binding domain-containing protein [Eubacteriales bacterium]